jgi:hypothetical protein
MIPTGYGTDLGGLWWSSNRDAIERRDGTTLAVVDEVCAVLQGALAKTPVPPFAFVLHLLHLMKRGGPGADHLRAAFEATRGAAARGRNAGALIAELCRPLPHAAGGLTGAEVGLALRYLRLAEPECPPDRVEEPSLTRAEFERRVTERLVRFDHTTLVHWFAHGCGPSGAGARLSKPVESLPERVARLLTHARRRERLVGAAALVSALDAALALPPRGHPPEALPVGGYCDVTTRGDPGRLLPGQFALDPDEFVRRFAANELLYFQREEPHAAVRPERVIVLDQGVRTWGSVRLALTAAALALLRVGAKRCTGARLFLTSAPEPIDLVDAEPEAVADRLEASDLTPNPSEALTRALDEPALARVPRDVILLTHARTVRDSVAGAAASRRPDDRLFSIAVTETGAAELVEWVAGGWTQLRSFRVDLGAAEAARCDPAAPHQIPRPVAVVGEWSGDIEPVPFPFRPGLITEPLQFGFDAEGEWLVIGGRDGLLHGLALDGTPPEVLPRAFWNGDVLRRVDALLGVTGGVVACGRMSMGNDHRRTKGTDPSGRRPVASSGASEPVPQYHVAAHYDRAARRVAVHVLGHVPQPVRWTAHPELNCIALRTASGEGCALDLATLGRHPSPAQASALVSRARLAWDRSASGGAPYVVPIGDRYPPATERPWGGPFLQRMGAPTVVLWEAPCPFTAASPQRNGKPLLDGADLHHAQLAGDILAMTYAKGAEEWLLVLSGPAGAVLGEVAHPVKNPFTLSRDGRRLARRAARRLVAVTNTSDPARTVASADQAALHDALAVNLGADPFHLTITIGGYQHTFRLGAGQLAYKARWEVAEQAERTMSTWSPASTAHDPARFPPIRTAHSRDFCAVVDRQGQVLLFRSKGGPVVAAFLVRRERAAAWAPGGGFWGDSRLIGGPPTPDAARTIGRAIIAAGGV